MSPRRGSEFRMYPDIRDNLRRLGWNTDNPATNPDGDVYDQHEAGADSGLRKALGLAAPEHVVVVDKSKRIFWTIEAKGTMAELAKAVKEAREYAEAINIGAKQNAQFYTGIAGNPTEGYLRSTYFIDSAGIHSQVQYDGSPISSLLPRETLLYIVKSDDASLLDLALDENELLRTASVINETLHNASINKDDRAPVVASILLTMAMDNMPDAHLPPATYAEQINLTASARLAKAGKQHFAEHIALRLPRGEDAQHKFVGALVATADALRHINIAAAMRSGTDVLGEFYEAFLKYGNGAKDLGIVLTPRHITRWAARVVPITDNDVVFDPTCGTGGFLVSAFDQVRMNQGIVSDFEGFRTLRIFGIEQQPKIAALAVINMIFRGDGSANIIDDDALSQFVTYSTKSGKRTARFVAVGDSNGPPGATRVLMNPPFALRAEDEKEYRFVDHALAQLEDRGLLFSVLPSPVMVKSGAPLTWRRDRLLANNTLRAVVAFPEDLFYPGVSVDTVGMVIEKGRPHQPKDQVLWARVPTDGFAKVKGTRRRSVRVADYLQAITADTERSIRAPGSKVKSIPGVIKKAPLDPDDSLVELLPQVYLDEPQPTAAMVINDLQHAVREYLAFLIRTADTSTLARALTDDDPDNAPDHDPNNFALFSLTEIFGKNLSKGDIHAMNVEDAGPTPVVSSSTESNGILGFYDLDPDWRRVRDVITIACNGTPLTSFFHPYEIVAKDDVIVCVPPAEFPVETVFYLITALNAITWRFSYYRKAFLNKVDKINIFLPATKDGDIDHEWIRKAVHSCEGWSQLSSAMPTWQPGPFLSLGKSGSAADPAPGYGFGMTEPKRDETTETTEFDRFRNLAKSVIHVSRDEIAEPDNQPKQRS